jgi:hypothetical protein
MLNCDISRTKGERGAGSSGKILSDLCHEA